MKYILYTNVISELTKTNPNSKVLDFLNSLAIEDIYLSSITIGDILWYPKASSW